MSKSGRPRIGDQRVCVVFTPEQLRFIDAVRTSRDSRPDVIRSIVQIASAQPGWQQIAEARVTPERLERFQAFLEVLRAEWGCSTLEETHERLLYELSDEAANLRVAKALA